MYDTFIAPSGSRFYIDLREFNPRTSTLTSFVVRMMPKDKSLVEAFSKVFGKEPLFRFFPKRGEGVYYIWDFFEDRDGLREGLETDETVSHYEEF